MKLKFVLVPVMILGLSIGSYAEETKWITSSKKVCVGYGGKINNEGVCKAKWLDAEDICRASGGRLPSRYELKKVLVDCGGIIDFLQN
ncbi:MAG: Unknown protein [uncultured Sulfurovum sp.]|uniref:Uncharacterized protein n=1 Tax=uncultured Sulfurovum sp. TaxID=269237 RepID=A0A6S6T4V5_9BACT|nr:MAG: Unknown protein [uncultured Sulfurovum sp.]